MVEPPLAEPHERWCERSVGEIIAYLLLDCLKSLKGGGADDLTCRSEEEYQWIINDNHEMEAIYGKEKKY